MISIAMGPLRILCIFCVVASVLSQGSNDQRCNRFAGKQGFNISQITGDWKGIRQSGWGSSCFLDNLSVNQQGNLLSVISYLTPSGERLNQTLIAVPCADQPSKIQVFLSENSAWTSFGSWVFLYSNPQGCFAVVSASLTLATDGTPQHSVILLVLCRTINPSPAELQRAVNSFTFNGLDSSTLQPIEHTNC